MHVWLSNGYLVQKVTDMLTVCVTVTCSVINVKARTAHSGHWITRQTLLDYIRQITVGNYLQVWLEACSEFDVISNLCCQKPCCIYKFVFMGVVLRVVQMDFTCILDFGVFLPKVNKHPSFDGLDGPSDGGGGGWMVTSTPIKYLPSSSPMFLETKAVFVHWCPPQSSTWDN